MKVFSVCISISIRYQWVDVKYLDRAYKVYSRVTLSDFKENNSIQQSSKIDK